MSTSTNNKNLLSDEERQMINRYYDFVEKEHLSKRPWFFSENVAACIGFFGTIFNVSMLLISIFTLNVPSARSLNFFLCFLLGLFLEFLYVHFYYKTDLYYNTDLESSPVYEELKSLRELLNSK